MLEDLPTELLEHVATFLPKEDLLTIRLASSILSSKTYTIFSTAWFTTLICDLSESGFARLQSIAEHPKLRLAVHKLIPGRQDDDKDHSDKHRPGLFHPWNRTEEGYLDPNSSAVKSLRRWQQNDLINCRSFEITDLNGCFPRDEFKNTKLSPADVILLILMATKGLPVRSFRVQLKTGKIIITPFQLPSHIIHETVSSPGWVDNLQDLQLHWVSRIDNGLEVMKEMIVSSTQLQRLSLEVESWRAASALLQELSSPQILLPRIRTFRISCIRNMTSSTLSTFLLRFKESLESIELTDMWLHADLPEWKSLLQILATDFPRLRNVTFWNWEMSSPHDNVINRMLFCPLAGKEKLDDWEGFSLLEHAYEGFIGVRYRGRDVEDVRKALRAIGEAIYVFTSPLPKQLERVGDGAKVRVVGSFGDFHEGGDFEF